MEEKEKKKRVRSPNYPCIPLEGAIELVETLYNIQKQYWVPLEIAAKDWKFSSAKSSYLAQHVAALASYGLIDVEGEKESRKIKVSDTAFKIILDKRPESMGRASLIKDAALKPNIFRKIYEVYPTELPPDHTLEYELVTKYEFNPSAVKEFIGVFKKTLDYAGVYKSCIIGDENNPIEEINMPIADKTPIKDGLPEKQMPPPILCADEREIANYPISRGLKARIIVTGASPVTADSIEKLRTLLEHNKEDLAEILPNEKAADPTEN